MKNIITKFGFSIVAVTVMFTGCGDSKNLVPKNIKAETTQNKVYKIPKTDNIDNKEITIDDIKNNIKNNFNWIYKDISTLPTIRDTVKIDLTNNNEVKVNLTKYSSLFCDGVVTATSKYTIVDEGSFYKVILNTPYDINFSAETYWENLRGYKLCMPGGEEDYALKLLKKFPDTLGVGKTYELKGEVDSKYNGTAILANFKRILGKYNVSWINSENNFISNFSNEQKERTFALQVGKKTYPLYVEAMPYRDGSKITYFTKINYSIINDVPQTLTKNDISEINERIVSIINN